jgi:hypothetical protein
MFNWVSIFFFQKTVAQHEVFLSRLASHPVLKGDRNLHVFLGQQFYSKYLGSVQWDQVLLPDIVNEIV